jgi:hypothetical protein
MDLSVIAIIGGGRYVSERLTLGRDLGQGHAHNKLPTRPSLGPAASAPKTAGKAGTPDVAWRIEIAIILVTLILSICLEFFTS